MHAFNTRYLCLCRKWHNNIWTILSNTMQRLTSAQRDVTTVTRPVPTLSAPSPAHVGVDTHWTVMEGDVKVHVNSCIGIK